MKDTKIDIQTILNKLDYLDDDAIDRIKKAYNFALNEHDGLKRQSGDDYITHPLHVTEILIDLNVDETTIVASLLHEVLNHGNSTKEELESIFGSEVATIVECVSKINKLELNDETESSAIYLRKVLVGLAKDPRVLYIKLADRLHNMRTIWALPLEKQRVRANETMNVLIPIAHRLGINSIKSELENICLKILKPDIYNDILNMLNNANGKLNDNLAKMQNDLTQLLNENNIKHKIKSRVKSVYSIYNKMANGKKFKDIYDILALRIFVDSENECYQVINLIHSKYKQMRGRFKDYIANPKANMYQSLHTTIYDEDNNVFEVQVRTYEMDEIAEKGIASHWSYKEKGTKKVQAIMEQKLEMFRNIIEAYNEENEEAFASTVQSNLLSELIYVFTPKGDVIELPKDSTPIDFAYRIHSKIGDTLTGAIVNDSIVPLSYHLQNNDVVKLTTNSSATPNKDWLNFVKTPSAKAKIKSYFSKQEHEAIVSKGKLILEKELRKRKLSYSDVLNDDNLKKILKDLKLDTIDDLYSSIGSLRYTVGYIINLTKDDKQNVDDILMERLRPTIIKNNSKDDIIVDGNTNIMYSLAKCCHPVKGDEIIGFVTKGEGVSVHKKNCPNAKMKEERIIKVEWNDNSTNSYLSTLNIRINTTDNLTSIIEEAIREKLSIVEIKNNEIDHTLYSKITIKVKNKEELDNFKNHIKSFKNIELMENL